MLIPGKIKKKKKRRLERTNVVSKGMKNIFLMHKRTNIGFVNRRKKKKEKHKQIFVWHDFLVQTEKDERKAEFL